MQKLAPRYLTPVEFEQYKKEVAPHALDLLGTKPKNPNFLNEFAARANGWESYNAINATFERFEACNTGLLVDTVRYDDREYLTIRANDAIIFVCKDYDFIFKGRLSENTNIAEDFETIHEPANPSIRQHYKQVNVRNRDYGFNSGVISIKAIHEGAADFDKITISRSQWSIDVRIILNAFEEGGTQTNINITLDTDITKHEYLPHHVGIDERYPMQHLRQELAIKVEHPKIPNVFDYHIPR